MNIGFIQPPYPGTHDPRGTQATLDFMLSTLGGLTTPCDLIVLPEYANCAGLTDPTAMLQFADTQGREFLDAVAAVARRRQLAIAVNGLQRVGRRYGNVTLLIDSRGQVAARYLKTHLSPAEEAMPELIAGEESVIAEWNGIRLGFLTCFDLYFPEFAERLAAMSPDIVIVPAYQRSENSAAIVRQAAGRALDMEAFLVRCSYSMGSQSALGGHSLVADPTGKILTDAGQASGFFGVSLDPRTKRLRPASHGLGEMSSRQITEGRRRPHLYRPAGPGVGLKTLAPFPRVVAHRGLSGLCPENTLPAFAAAMALGAHEIEFDLWASRDGVLVVCHDPTLDRTSNGHGLIRETDWSAIRTLDAGSWFHPSWAGIPVCRLEDVMDLCGGRVAMNIHIKETGPDGLVVLRTRELAESRGLLNDIYIAGDKNVLACALKLVPDVARCCLEWADSGEKKVDCAIQYECRRLQFWNPNFTVADLERAHAHGIVCNAFFGNRPDTPEEAVRLCGIGIDAVLTNWANKVLPALRRSAGRAAGFRDDEGEATTLRGEGTCGGLDPGPEETP